jgi:hypothetical protein
MELLKNFPFVKVKPLTSAKAELFYDLRDAVNEVNLAKEGKIKLKSAKDLLHELYS